MSNDAVVEWGNQIRYCRAAIDQAVHEFGAQRLRIPCAETRVHTTNIDTKVNREALANARQANTFERVQTSDTGGLEKKLTQNVATATVEDDGWRRPERSVIEIENGMATDGSGVSVVEELKFTSGALDGIVLMFLKADEGLGKPSYVHGLAYTDGLGDPLLDSRGARIFDDHGNFLDPEKAAAYDAFVHKQLQLDRAEGASDPEFQAHVDNALLVAAAAAGLHEEARTDMADGLEHVVLSNFDASKEEEAAPFSTFTMGGS